MFFNACGLMVMALLPRLRVFNCVFLVLRLISLMLRPWDFCMVPYFLALLDACGLFLSLSSQGLFCFTVAFLDVLGCFT